jgi:hypothetical protein
MSQSPPLTRLPERLKWAGKEITDILLHADVTFAFVVLGISMIVWGIFGMIYTPDLEWFAKGFAFEVAPWLWGLNHMCFGYGFIHCALHKFPPGRSLLIGAGAIMCWTWIAMGRPSTSFSSGMTLNFVVILMGAVLVQRSGRE